MISREDLRSLAKTKSFSKGSSYYRGGFVRDAIRKGDSFEAIVMGSHNYKVNITTDGSEIIGHHCSCPYDWGGICKHIVALGLAIINRKYTTETHSNATNSQEKEVYLATDQKLRHSFLKQLFNKDRNLQSQFNNFTQAARTKDKMVPSSVDIDALRDEVYSELSNIVFDDEVYDGFDGYHEVTEDTYIEQLKDEVFTSYQNMTLEYIQKGNLLDALSVVLALYEGYYDVQEPGSDEYYDFDEYNNILARIFEEILKSLIDPFASAIKNEGTSKAMLDLFVERYQFYQSKYDKKLAELEKDIIQIVYHFKVFEDFILSLITSQSIAEHLEFRLRKNKLYTVDTVHLFLEIAEVTEDEDLWLQTAKDFAESDPVIARQLMVKYQYQDDFAAFYKTAKMAFDKWSDKMDTFLLKNISPTIERVFYITVLEHYVQRTKDIEKYKELKSYWKEVQKITFIKQNKRWSNFYVQILAEEKRYDEILEIANGHTYIEPPNFVLSDIPSLPLLIQLLVPIYPDQCFEISKNKIDGILVSGRGRSLYQSIATFLQELQNIKGWKMRGKDLASKIYKKHNRLSALRDEMRKAKVV